MGAHGSFGDGTGPRCERNAWHVVSSVVDTVAGTLRTFVDGKEVAEIKAAKVCKDGQHALKG